MSDRFAATIEIGGRVPRSLVEELCVKIEESGAGQDWNGGVEPRNEVDLREFVGERGTITLSDAEASYGCFPDLERFLVDHDIPFDRTSEAKWDYDGEVVKFRPGQEPYSLLATQDGEVALESAEVEEVVNRLDDGARLSKRELLQLVEEVRDDLRSLMAKDIPPVPPLEIVEG